MKSQQKQKSAFDEEFETHSFMKRMSDIFLLPVLNNLPAKSRGAIKKTHESAEKVIDNTTSHYALEILYATGKTFRSKNFLQKLFHTVWFQTANSKAVRNRLKIVRKQIHAHLDNGYGSKSRNILSIASGSARAVIEAVDSVNLENKKDLNLYFLDKSPKALEYSKKLAREHNLRINNCTWIEGTAATFLNEMQVKQKQFDLVEMVGLLDYFDDKKAIEVFSLVHSVLDNNGVFVTANIVSNPEQKFVTNVIGWEMIYREPEELKELILKSGFKKENVQVHVEPFGIHAVIVAKK